MNSCCAIVTIQSSTTPHTLQLLMLFAKPMMDAPDDDMSGPHLRIYELTIHPLRTERKRANKTLTLFLEVNDDEDWVSIHGRADVMPRTIIIQSLPLLLLDGDSCAAEC